MEKRIDRGVKLKMGPEEGSKTFLPEQVSSAIIPVEDVAVLFRCGKCLESPLKPPVHTCRSGHLTCSSCYQHSDFMRCYKCRCPLEYRNFVLEEVLRNLTVQTCAALNECGSTVHQSVSDQSLQLLLKDPAVLKQLEDARLEADRTQKESLMWLNNPANMTVNRASHRPVKCPYPCGRIVTCSAIFPHFEMQHSHIAKIKTYLDSTTVLDVEFMDVFAADIGCQGLFIVYLDTDRNQDDTDYSAAEMLKITRSSQEMLRNKILVSTLTVGHLKLPNEDVDDDFEFLTAWCTCLYDLSPLSYTLCATSDLSCHSASFTGPMVSLHGSQKPEDVCERGECLMLSPGLLRKMQFSNNNPLRLAVTFHSDLQLDSGDRRRAHD